MKVRSFFRTSFLLGVCVALIGCSTTETIETKMQQASEQGDVVFLIDTLKNAKSHYCRELAAEALGKQESNLHLVIPALVEALSDVSYAGGYSGRGVWIDGGTEFPGHIEYIPKEYPVRKVALKSLRNLTGQDFGEDILKWRRWWEKNKDWVIHSEAAEASMTIDRTKSQSSGSVSRISGKETFTTNIWAVRRIVVDGNIDEFEMPNTMLPDNNRGFFSEFSLPFTWSISRCFVTRDNSNLCVLIRLEHSLPSTCIIELTDTDCVEGLVICPSKMLAGYGDKGYLMFDEQLTAQCKFASITKDEFTVYEVGIPINLVSNLANSDKLTITVKYGYPIY